MKVSELMDELKKYDKNATVSLAEVEEAFGYNVASVEFVENGKIQSQKADGTEAIELENGDNKVLVLRF